MKNILLVDDETEILSLVKELLNDELPEAIVTCSKNGVEAISHLESSVKFDLVICDYYMPKSNGEEVFAYNYSHKKYPFMFLTGAFIEDLTHIENFKEDNTKNFLVLKPYDEDNFISKIKKIFAAEGGVLANYQKTKISLLRKFVNTDVQINVFFQEENEEYKLIIDSNSGIISTVLEDYAKRGITYLYVQEDDHKALMQKLERQLLLSSQVVVDSVNEPQEKKMGSSDHIETLSKVFEYVHEGLYSLGIGEKQIAIADKSINFCIDSMSKNESLFPHISNLIEMNNYLISHGVMTAHISSALARKLDFKNSEILSKLSYASLFQNITLKDDKLAKVMDENSVMFKDLSVEERRSTLGHPREVARIVESCSFLPSDIITLVENHHEKPDSTGFPRKLSGNYINILSSIFNLSVVIADHICKFGYKEESLAQLSAFLNENYNQAMFKKPLGAYFEIVENQN